MPYKSKKSEEDFNQRVSCEDCGKETGPFVMDTDDHEILCIDCAMALGSSAKVDFEAALESSTNWEQQSNRNGLLLLRCVHCHELADEDFGQEDDDGALYAATEFLEEDKEHDCEEEEEDEEEEDEDEEGE